PGHVRPKVVGPYMNRVRTLGPADGVPSPGRSRPELLHQMPHPTRVQEPELIYRVGATSAACGEVDPATLRGRAGRRSHERGRAAFQSHHLRAIYLKRGRSPLLVRPGMHRVDARTEPGCIQGVGRARPPSTFQVPRSIRILDPEFIGRIRTT